MKFSIIDVVMFVCCTISLILYTVSGLRKKIPFKEIFKKRIKNVFNTIMILIFSNAMFYLTLLHVQERIRKQIYKIDGIPEIIVLIILCWVGRKARDNFEEKYKKEGYTKLDHVASFFLSFSLYLFIVKIILLILSGTTGMFINEIGAL